MQLPVYTPSVQKTEGGNARVVAPSNYGAPGALMAQGLSAMSKGLGALNAAVTRQQEEADAVNAQAASNEYTKRMNDLLYDPDKGLMQTKLQGADGITGTFEEQEKKIRQEVYGQFKFNTRKGQLAFQNLVNNTAAQRYEMVRKHQTKQNEAYQDVVFANAVEDQAQFVTNAYGDEQALANSVAETEKLTAAKYFNQGEEAVKAQVRKNCGTVVGRAMAAALANEDYDTLDTIRNRYGEYLSPEQSINAMKIANNFARGNMELQLFKEAYAACGNDPYAVEKFIENYCANTGGNAEAVHECFRKTKGQPYQLGAAEDGVNGNWDCGAWTKWVAKHCGLGGIITNRCADTQFKQFEDAGRAFGPEQESKLRDGDFVFWTGTGGAEGYKGIAHVGIYNGKTGRVMQSGTHGVAECDLHQYKIVGFGRGAGGVGRSPVEVEKLKSKALQYITGQEGKKRAYTNSLVHEGELKMMDLLNQDETNIGEYQKIAGMYSANDEARIRLQTKLASIQKGFEKAAAKAGSESGGGKSNPLAVYELGVRLQRGEDPEGLRNNVLASGDYTGADKVKMLKLIDGLNDTLKKEYNVSAIVNDMTAGYVGTDKAAYKKSLEEYTAGQIADYIGKNNVKPTVAQIQDMIRYGTTKQKVGGFLGTKIDSPVKMLMRIPGLQDYRVNESGGYNVRVNNGWYRISDRQIVSINNGEMTLEQALREGYR